MYKPTVNTYICHNICAVGWSWAAGYDSSGSPGTHKSGSVAKTWIWTVLYKLLRLWAGTARVVGWSRAAVDSVKLGLVICLTARSIRVGMGLNPHKVWWAELACVKSYDWIPCGPAQGVPETWFWGCILGCWASLASAFDTSGSPGTQGTVLRVITWRMTHQPESQGDIPDCPIWGYHICLHIQTYVISKCRHIHM